MIEIKQIIKSRITDIKTLQELISNASLDSSSKYQTIASHKKLERMRTIKESELLCSLNQLTLNSSKQIQEFYDFSVQICSLYDDKYNRYYEKISVSMKQNIRVLYASFFKQHGFSYKLKQLNQIFECDLAMISPSMFFGWLGEWSKKIYSDMLQNQLRKEICKKKEASFSDFRQYKNFKAQRVRSFQPEFQKAQYSLELQSKNKAFKKVSFRPQIFIHNRENVYGYMLQDLTAVYKFYAFEDLDFTLLKTIKKLGKKNELLEQSNLEIATQMLLSTSNQEKKKTINQYSISYHKKYPAPPKKKLSSNSTYSPPKKIKRQPTEISQQNNNQQQTPSPSKLLSPKISQFEFIQQRIQSKLSRLKIISRSQTKKFNVQFPRISKKKINNDLSYLPSIVEMKQKDRKSKLLRFYKNNQYEKINVSEMTIMKPTSKTTKFEMETFQNQQPPEIIGQMFREDSFKKQLKYILQERLRQQHSKHQFKNFNPEQFRKKTKMSSLILANQ